MATKPRLTKVQRDVLERMADGWTIPKVLCAGDWRLCKPGEPSRHLAAATVESLVRRGLICRDDGPGGMWGYVLSEKGYSAL